MQNRAALLVIDIQPDFCPGGALAVPEGDAIIPLVNRIAARFANVVLTQDWHPADHISFAPSHPGRQPFETINLPYGPQVLWPAHCVQGTPGAALHTALQIPHARLILRKGGNRLVDSYSAFLEADRVSHTGLAGYLRDLGATELYLCGLATDFCVAWSAEDAVRAGFSATIIEDACRAIDLDGSLAAAWARLTASGVRRLASGALPPELRA